MDDSDYPDLGAVNPVDEVVRVAGKNQFARCARFGYPARQWEAGELLGLADDVVNYLFSGDRVVG